MADQQQQTAKAQSQVATDHFSTLYSIRKSYTDEVKAKINRLDGLIGPAHYLSVGNYKEQIIREQVERVTPKKLSVNTGFVISHRDGATIRSKQIDILVWDSTNFAPIIQASDFVVIPPEALRAAIEVKGVLDHSALGEALDNLESLTPFSDEMMRLDAQSSHGRFPFVRYLVAGDVKKDGDGKSVLNFPDSIWNKLYSYYPEKTVEGRLQWCKLWYDYIPMAWINGIAVLNHGFLAATVHAQTPSFLSYQLLNRVDTKSAPPVEDDSIGLFCAHLGAALVQPRFYAHAVVARPYKNEPQLVLPRKPEAIAMVTNSYTPRNPPKPKDSSTEAATADAAQPVAEPSTQLLPETVQVAPVGAMSSPDSSPAGTEGS